MGCDGTYICENTCSIDGTIIVPSDGSCTDGWTVFNATEFNENNPYLSTTALNAWFGFTTNYGYDITTSSVYGPYYSYHGFTETYHDATLCDYGYDCDDCGPRPFPEYCTQATSDFNSFFVLGGIVWAYTNLMTIIAECTCAYHYREGKHQMLYIIYRLLV